MRLTVVLSLILFLCCVALSSGAENQPMTRPSVSALPSTNSPAIMNYTGFEDSIGRGALMEISGCANLPAIRQMTTVSGLIQAMDQVMVDETKEMWGIPANSTDRMLALIGGDSLVSVRRFTPSLR